MRRRPIVEEVPHQRCQSHLPRGLTTLRITPTPKVPISLATRVDNSQNNSGCEVGQIPQVAHNQIPYQLQQHRRHILFKLKIAAAVPTLGGSRVILTPRCSRGVGKPGEGMEVSHRRKSLWQVSPLMASTMRSRVGIQLTARWQF